jgi:D-serine dehydratase
MKQMLKAELMEDLRGRLVDLFTKQRLGADGATLARAHGYVDGCMKVMLDSGMTSKQELLLLVATQRELIDGPARRRLEPPARVEQKSGIERAAAGKAA